MNETGTRELLLDAAEQAFAEGGFRGATVRQITGRARANLGAVTYHFGSKAALFEAVVERAIRELHRIVEAAARGRGTPPERLERIILAHFAFLHEHPRLRRLILHVLLRDQDLPAAIAHFRGAMAVVATVIAEGQGTRHFRPGDPMLLAISAMTQSVMFNLMRPMLRRGPGIDLDRAAVRHRVVDHVLAFVRGGMVSPARQGRMT